MSRPERPAGSALKAPPRRLPAPPFEEADSDNRRVRLKSLLGRHRLLVAVFDGRSGPCDDLVLAALRDRHAELESHDVRVLAIGEARPAAVRDALRACGAFPFPLLCDVEHDTLALWGCWDDPGERTRPALFLVDRAGRVAWDDARTSPRPVDDPLATIDRLARGED
jgi:peroxiredoxin